MMIDGIAENSPQRSTLGFVTKVTKERTYTEVLADPPEIGT